MTDSRNGSHATKLRIGSRGSQLALWQANHISALLRARGHEVEIEIIHTTGDKITDVALAMVGTKGMFTKEIEEALAAGRVDLAVHSLKDLPTDLPPGFEIAAITERQDPRDAFCSRQYPSFQELPQGARVGTSSLRRQAQLKAVRPDLDIHPLRGNVDTRLRKLAEGECDALVLACAGLDRLGRAESVHQRFPINELCPAPGQGALGLETRAPSYAALAAPEHDNYVRRAVAALDHADTRFAVEAERTVLDALGGGCQIPIGVHCSPVRDGDSTIAWHVHAQVLAPDGERIICLSTEEPVGIAAATLGRQVAEELKSRGALELLQQPV